MTERYVYNLSKPNATQVDIEFDKANLLAELVKEIGPDYDAVHTDYLLLLLCHQYAILFCLEAMA